MCLRFRPRARLLRLLTVSLCALFLILCVRAARAQTQPPVLLSEETTTRAISLESIRHNPEPFPPDSPVLWSPDGRTRVEVFAMSLALQPGEDASAVTAFAQDASGQRYDLNVEYVRAVPGFEWMTAVSLRLADDLADVGDVLVWVKYHGLTSNRVRIGIGHVGDGPTDDAGARPTPPRLISGHVLTTKGSGIGGVTILVGGSQTAALKTAADGSYSFIAAPLGDYSLTPQLPFFDFQPQSRGFVGLDESHGDADFSAVRQTRKISGQLRDEEGRQLSNFRVTMTGAPGFEPLTNTTDEAGQFSFFDVPAGFALNVTVASDFVDFTPLKIEQLAGDLTLSISGTRRRCALKGRVADYAGGVAGASVSLVGSGLTTTTDADGNYHFDGLGTGLAYEINASKAEYIFDQPDIKVNELQCDSPANFHVTPNFILSGRVTDAGCSGVFGIYVLLAGPQNGITFTDADGRYSFVVNLYGDYTLTPAKEQGFYSFSPQSGSVAGVKGARTSDFTATLSPTSIPSRVLEFDGGPKSVDYGFFWDPEKDLGHFFWEFWAMPGSGASSTYMIADGFGGAHALLFGFGNFGGFEANHYQFTGNIWDGTKLTDIASDEGPQIGEWGHYSIGWDGQYVVTYFDGVPVGRNRFDGPRRTAGPAGGGGKPYVGGTNHSNLVGRIAQVRGYEDLNPRERGVAGAVYSSFRPQTLFGVEGNFLSWFFRVPEGDYVADLSKGKDGMPHNGAVRGWVSGQLDACFTCPKPQFVTDPTAPNFSNPGNPGQTPAPSPTPAAAPTGALVFDSFSRRNSTYILGGNGGLGSTEAGSRGALAWQTALDQSKPQPFGILNGRAVLLASDAAVAWVSAGVGKTDLDVRVDRRPRTNETGQNTGLSFRVADASNYFFAYTSEGGDRSAPKTLTVGCYLNGVRTDLGSVSNLPNDPFNPWITLRVLTYADGRIKVFAGPALVFSTTSAVFSNSTGAGLYNNAAGLALTNRWDNFTVFNAP